MAAKGIYAVMTMYRSIAGFVLHKTMLMNRFAGGKAAFNKAWEELQECGYLKIERKHINGRYAYDYQIFDQPYNGETDGQASGYSSADLKIREEQEESRQKIPYPAKNSFFMPHFV